VEKILAVEPMRTNTKPFGLRKAETHTGPICVWIGALLKRSATGIGCALCGRPTRTPQCSGQVDLGPLNEQIRRYVACDKAVAQNLGRSHAVITADLPPAGWYCGDCTCGQRRAITLLQSGHMTSEGRPTSTDTDVAATQTTTDFCICA
jgi:hypothetical protein